MHPPARIAAFAIVAFASAAALSMLSAASGVAEDSPYLITTRQIPPEYKITAEFLEYLKPATDAPSGFAASAAPKWDIARLLSFISADGFSVSDVNRRGKAVKYSVPQIRSAVTARKGQAFQTLAHLGHIYAQPYKQYSELRFEPQGADVAVSLADWYTVTFVRQDETLKLTRIDYHMREAH